MTQAGWAADGFPIYDLWAHGLGGGCEESGERDEVQFSPQKWRASSERRQPGGPFSGVFEEDFEYVAGSGDLDECGGRIGVTPEFLEGTYYYVITENKPFVPQAFSGEADTSFPLRMGPPGGGGLGGLGPLPADGRSPR
jgi:hypothetical protein